MTEGGPLAKHVTLPYFKAFFVWVNGDDVGSYSSENEKSALEDTFILYISIYVIERSP